MNKIIIGLALAGMLLGSCAKEDKIGEIAPLTSDYTLPQGKSPADSRIVELHKKYGSFFLYEFTRRDFDWKLVNTSLGEFGEEDFDYTYTPADPKYVGEMLDLLQGIWFDFYPEGLLKKMMPYRVLLVSTLEESFYGDVEEKAYRIADNQIVISNCSEALLDMTGEEKRALKAYLQSSLLSYLMTTNVINFPEAFGKVSDYSSAANVDDPNSDNYARVRGFIDTYNFEYEEWSEWSGWPKKGPLNSGMDENTYINAMLIRTSEEWEADLKYPLVKEKYDILRQYYIDHYGVDLQKIGDTVFE